MSNEAELKIKGAAARATEKEETEPEPEPAKEATPPPATALEDGEVTDKDTGDDQTGQAQSTPEENLARYRWCKCICDPAQYGGDHYFLHLDTQESRWDEPTEPYWLWNTDKQALDNSGLHYPSTTTAHTAPTTTSNEPDPEYTGYNPKIHGSYDPTAPYAQYHNRKREEENLLAQGYDPATSSDPAAYAATGTFNRFTGAYQSADKSTERHTDHAKSGRQMNAYFDVDAAANMHDGRSLKEERRNEKLSKKQIKELAEKRRAKKEKKRMDFYRS